MNHSSLFFSSSFPTLYPSSRRRTLNYFFRDQPIDNPLLHIGDVVERGGGRHPLRYVTVADPLHPKILRDKAHDLSRVTVYTATHRELKAFVVVVVVISRLKDWPYVAPPLCPGDFRILVRRKRRGTLTQKSRACLPSSARFPEKLNPNKRDKFYWSGCR